MIKTKFNTTNKKKKEHLKIALKSKRFKEGNKITKKNVIQKAVLKDWREHDHNAMFLLSMGVGKSKIISDAATDFFKRNNPIQNPDKYDVPVLILVNSSALRDTGLPEELRKWKCSFFSEVRIECYQFAYKNKLLLKDKVGLLICDEIDFSVSEKMGQLFDTINCEERLYLTGTLNREKRELIKTYKKFPPIVYEYPVKQAQKDNVINKTKIYLHHVDLYKEKNIPIKYKKDGVENTFLTSEQENYVFVDKKIGACKILIKQNQTKDPIAVKKYTAMKTYWESSPRNDRSRVSQLTQNQSLIDYANKLRDTVLSKDSENKVIFFATRKETIDKLTPNGYYGKVSDDIIGEFNLGNIRDIGVCKKANRGVNFKGLNHCIAQSYTSSETDQNQGIIGRMTRLDTGDVAAIHILVSMYETLNKTTDYCWSYEWVKDLIDNNIDDLVLVEDDEDIEAIFYTGENDEESQELTS